jgi:hypothetical protein
VKIGDGCATVTGYKLPKPLIPQTRIGKAGARFRPGVRISVGLCSSRLPGTIGSRPFGPGGYFSVKEKDEASPSAGAARDSWNAFIRRFAGGEGFMSSALCTGLSIVNQNKLKDQLC